MRRWEVQRWEAGGGGGRPRREVGDGRWEMQRWERRGAGSGGQRWEVRSWEAGVGSWELGVGRWEAPSPVAIAPSPIPSKPCSYLYVCPLAMDLKRRGMRCTPSHPAVSNAPRNTASMHLMGSASRSTSRAVSMMREKGRSLL